MRAVRRATPELAPDARRALDTLTLTQIATAVFDQAGRLDPVTLRNPDAIHLAAALDLGDDLDGLVTYDGQLTRVVAGGRSGGDRTRRIGLPCWRRPGGSALRLLVGVEVETERNASVGQVCRGLSWPGGGAAGPVRAGRRGCGLLARVRGGALRGGAVPGAGRVRDRARPGGGRRAPGCGPVGRMLPSTRPPSSWCWPEQARVRSGAVVGWRLPARHRRKGRKGGVEESVEAGPAGPQPHGVLARSDVASRRASRRAGPVSSGVPRKTLNGRTPAGALSELLHCAQHGSVAGAGCVRLGCCMPLVRRCCIRCQQGWDGTASGSRVVSGGRLGRAVAAVRPGAAARRAR